MPRCGFVVILVFITADGTSVNRVPLLRTGCGDFERVVIMPRSIFIIILILITAVQAIVRGIPLLGAGGRGYDELIVVSVCGDRTRLDQPAHPALIILDAVLCTGCANTLVPAAHIVPVCGDGLRFNIAAQPALHVFLAIFGAGGIDRRIPAVHFMAVGCGNFLFEDLSAVNAGQIAIAVLRTGHHRLHYPIAYHVSLGERRLRFDTGIPVCIGILGNVAQIRSAAVDRGIDGPDRGEIIILIRALRCGGGFVYSLPCFGIDAVREGIAACRGIAALTVGVDQVMLFRIVIIRRQLACKIAVGYGGIVARTDAADSAVIIAFMTGKGGMHGAVAIAVIEQGIGECRNAVAVGLVCGGIDGHRAVVAALGHRAILQNRHHATCVAAPIIGVIVDGHVTLVAAIFDHTVGIAGGCDTTRAALAALAACLDVTCVFTVVHVRLGLAVADHTTCIGMRGRAVGMNAAVIISIADCAIVAAADAAHVGADVVVIVLVCRAGIDLTVVGAIGHVAVILSRNAAHVRAAGVGPLDVACVIAVGDKAACISHDTARKHVTGSRALAAHGGVVLAVLNGCAAKAADTAHVGIDINIVRFCINLSRDAAILDGGRSRCCDQAACVCVGFILVGIGADRSDRVTVLHRSRLCVCNQRCAVHASLRALVVNREILDIEVANISHRIAEQRKIGAVICL